MPRSSCAPVGVVSVPRGPPTSSTPAGTAPRAHRAHRVDAARSAHMCGIGGRARALAADEPFHRRVPIPCVAVEVDVGQRPQHVGDGLPAAQGGGYTLELREISTYQEVSRLARSPIPVSWVAAPTPYPVVRWSISSSAWPRHSAAAAAGSTSSARSILVARIPGGKFGERFPLHKIPHDRLGRVRRMQYLHRIDEGQSTFAVTAAAWIYCRNVFRRESRAILPARPPSIRATVRSASTIAGTLRLLAAQYSACL